MALAGVAVALAGCGGHKGQPQRGPAEVGVVTIVARPLDLTIELPGRTSPFEVADVRPQVGGIIIARPFTEGGNVRAGEVLYKIDPAPYQAALDQAKGLLGSAQANLATTQNKASRYADLVKINAVSKQDYDDASAAYKQAVATVQQQKAALESARINLDYTRVTAPISGRAGLSAYTKGALVTPSQTTALTTVQRLDPIYVDLTQSAAQVLKLRQEIESGKVNGAGAQGVPVRLKLEDGSTYPVEGRLQFTDVTVDQTTGSVTLRAVFPNPKNLLLPGLYVRAQIIEGVDPNGILAPQEGVSRNEKGQPTALVVDSTGHAQSRLLTTSRAIGDKWLVTSGLSPGDRLIVEGTQGVKPGAPVHATSGGSAASVAPAPGLPQPGE
jgi:membrane fusion protein (multidrug efflux system)